MCHVITQVWVNSYSDSPGIICIIIMFRERVGYNRMIGYNRTCHCAVTIWRLKLLRPSSCIVVPSSLKRDTTMKSAGVQYGHVTCYVVIPHSPYPKIATLSFKEISLIA